MPKDKEGRRAPQADRDRAVEEGLEPALLDELFAAALEHGGTLALELDAWRRQRRSLANALGRSLLAALESAAAAGPEGAATSGAYARPTPTFAPGRDPRRVLSPREREVVAGLERGHRVGAIAERLGLSHHTVRNHLKSVFHKLRVSSQVELLAKLRGDTDPPPR